MKRLIAALLYIMNVFLLFSCSSLNICEGTIFPSTYFPKKWQKDTCFTLIVDIGALTERYNLTKDTDIYNTTIHLIDSALDVCNYKYDLVNTKFKLVIQNNNITQKDIDWFDQLDSFYCFSDIEKIYYINTLSSIYYNNLADTFHRNYENRELLKFMKQNIYYNFSDTNLISDFSRDQEEDFKRYYFVQGRCENIDSLIQTLYVQYNNNLYKGKESLFFEIISTLEKMKLKSFPIEYDYE